MNRLPTTLVRWLGAALLGISSSSVLAATFVVNSDLDPGTGSCNATECTLREAITAANATTTADTINFSFAINLRSSDPDPDAIITDVLIQPLTLLPTISQPLTINGYSVAGSSANTNALVSNAHPRIRVDGFLAPSPADGFIICASNTTIKGLSITRFSAHGIKVTCASAISGVIIAGNFIGLGTNGSTDLGNAQNGLLIADGQVTVGGTAVADRNVIGGNSINGIGISNDALAGTTVLNNLIGTDKSGTLDRGNFLGIVLDSTGTTIGSATAPNRISWNTRGVQVGPNGASNRLQANHYSDNEGLGIDLMDAGAGIGVSLNDNGDGDGGGNGQQNYLDDGFTAQRTATGINIQGALRRIATTSVTFTIAAYANDACDASAHGEGQTFLGAATEVTTTGVAPINVDIPLATQPPFGTVITTTVTSPGGSTSEFSTCAALDPPPLVVNNLSDTADGVCNLAHCSLRDAIIAANANPAGDLIRFNIVSPASGELMIPLLSSLPTITAPVTIDGYSQPGTSVNTDPEASNAVLRIRIDGLNAVSGNNLIEVCSNDVTLRGLSITRKTTGGTIGVSICPGLAATTVIAGCFIGLAADGVAAAANVNGIIANSPTTIGGPSIADRNVIGANTGSGISLQNHAASVVLGNLIGTDKSGALNRGQLGGIQFSNGSTNAQIGSASAPNLIRFNLRAITTNASTTISNNRWTHNILRDSVSLGADLAGNGVTVNDADDADTGANALQNFPVITRAERSSAGILISGSLDVPVGSSNVPYLIGVYANEDCDSSGHGEGEFLLGSSTVNLTQGSGENFQFLINTEADLVVNGQITATATGPQGSSEFSACVVATDAAPGIVVDSTLDVGTTSGGCTVIGDANECTLREAITLANAQVGADLIRFELSGAGPFLILPDTLLPAITEALTIDGFSQQGAAPNAAVSGSDAVLQIELRDGASVAFGLMTCASDVTIQGLSFTQFNTAAIATQMNASASCTVQGNNVRILGNYIGVRPNGGGGSNAGGISVANTVVQIGGIALAERNIISNGTAFGVRISGATSGGSVIHNNLIGTGEDIAADLGNIAAGIEINSASNITAGGEGQLGNLIAFNNSGVLVLGSGTGNRVHANEFVSNDTLGIDLSTAAGINGVTANDVNDTDSGPNNLQNFPVLSDGSATPASITINGILDVPAGIVTPLAYTLAFYESTSCDGSGNGEGLTYLGSQSVGFVSSSENFSVTLPIAPASGATAITATATDPNGNTSEFSSCLSGPRPEPMFADGFE